MMVKLNLKNTSISIWSLIAIALLLCCNKPYDGGFLPGPLPCSDSNTIKLPSDMMSRMYFKDSTYWIYEDSVSHIIDSVWVDESSLITTKKFERFIIDKKCYDYFNYDQYSNINGKKSFSCYPNYIHDESKFSDVYFNIKIIDTSTANYNTLFRMKGDKYLNDGRYKLIENLDYLNVKQNVFKDVLHFKDISNTFEHLDAYYAPHFGIVKYRSKSGRVWELLRCHINQ